MIPANLIKKPSAWIALALSTLFTIFGAIASNAWAEIHQKIKEVDRVSVDVMIVNKAIPEIQQDIKEINRGMNEIRDFISRERGRRDAERNRN